MKSVTDCSHDDDYTCESDIKYNATISFLMETPTTPIAPVRTQKIKKEKKNQIEDRRRRCNDFKIRTFLMVGA